MKIASETTSNYCLHRLECETNEPLSYFQLSMIRWANQIVYISWDREKKIIMKKHVTTLHVIFVGVVVVVWQCGGILKTWEQFVEFLTQILLNEKKKTPQILGSFTDWNIPQPDRLSSLFFHWRCDWAHSGSDAENFDVIALLPS